MESLQYNSERTPLIIPEYGRHLHVMVDQMLVTEDREERNKKAKAIIGVMGNLNPHLRDVPDFQHKLGIFNQDISSWNISSVVQMEHIFDGATSFNHV